MLCVIIHDSRSICIAGNIISNIMSWFLLRGAPSVGLCAKSPRQ